MTYFILLYFLYFTKLNTAIIPNIAIAIIITFLVPAYGSLELFEVDA